MTNSIILGMHGDAKTSLLSRKGSLSAPDPFARNLHGLDSPRETLSRLTLMYVSTLPEVGSGEQPGEGTITLGKPRSRAHTTTSVPGRGPGSNGEARKERLSFAASSFSDTALAAPRSPTETSPQLTHRQSLRTGSRVRRATLSPQQTFELARSSLNFLARGNASHSPQPASTAQPLTPAPLTELPESHYLPFLDRPAEVQELLGSEANARLLALLRQTFPPHLRDTLDGPADQDPADWSFHSLTAFLCETPRSEALDAAWVSKVRRCVLAHSEILWERLKGILGVPSELEGEDAEGPDASDVEDETDEAWVEPVFPPTPGDASPTPGFMGPSYSFEDDSLKSRVGGRGNEMETIGEGDEAENVASASQGGVEDVSPADAEDEDALESIRALRFHTRKSFSGGRASPPDSKRGSVALEGDARTWASGRRLSRSQTMRERGAIRPELERGPGNPLFPGNFGCLSIGPTLKANNPASRRRWSPLPSAYAPPSGGHDAQEVRELFRRRSMDRSDYAITCTSESDYDGAVGDTKRSY